LDFKGLFEIRESGLGTKGVGWRIGRPAKFRFSDPVPEIWPPAATSPGGKGQSSHFSGTVMPSTGYRRGFAMHVPLVPLLGFCAATLAVLLVVLPMEWNRLSRDYADRDKPKRRPGQLSND